jgi:ferritin-like metal-binding protein YciE
MNMTRTPQEQLVHFLSDMYSVEQQALAQMVRAPDLAEDPGLAEDFRQHHEETKQQAQMVGERLEALGGTPSKIKDAIMKAGGKGFLLFAQTMPETPGRLVDHAYSYEAMEWAGYEMLKRFAERAGDAQTLEMAREIGEQERAMMQRLERRFDAAEQISHQDCTPEEVSEHIVSHLGDVHAFECQGISLLNKSEQIAGSDRLASLYAQGREMAGGHAELVEQRLTQLGSDTSTLKDRALQAGGLNWGWFFQAQSDTPPKLAAFVYAVLHLSIGGYELLNRTARRGADVQTTQLCERVIADKRQMAQRLAEAFDSAVQSQLEPPAPVDR